MTRPRLIDADAFADWVTARRREAADVASSVSAVIRLAANSTAGDLTTAPTQAKPPDPSSDPAWDHLADLDNRIAEHVRHDDDYGPAFVALALGLAMVLAPLVAALRIRDAIVDTATRARAALTTRTR